MRAVMRFHPLLGWEGAEARPGRAVGRRPVPVSLQAKRGGAGGGGVPAVCPARWRRVSVGGPAGGGCAGGISSGGESAVLIRPRSVVRVHNAPPSPGAVA